MKRLVLQVNVDHSGKKFKTAKTFKRIDSLYEISMHQAQKFAKKWDADYRCITTCDYLPEKHAAYQRLEVFEMTEYDQILYLDCDAVIMENCPNPFELFKDAEFSAPRDFPWDKKQENHEKVRQEFIKLFGSSQNYRPFCSGVMLMSRAFLDKGRDHWRKYIDSFDTKGHDQSILNQLIVNQGETYNELDEKWGTWYKRGEHIDHLAGTLRKAGFDPEKYAKKNNLIDFLPETTYTGLFE